MKIIEWNSVKDERLRFCRGVGFSEIIGCELVDILDHPKRTDQRLMLFLRKDYIWVVPYVDQGDKIFLKTLYPCRKFTKIYLRE